MTMAANLREAAWLTYDQMGLLFPDATAIHSALSDFVTAVDVVVPDSQVNNRPVGNWLIPMSTLVLYISGSAPNTAIPLNLFDQAVDMVSKLCWAATEAIARGLMTAGQGVTILAAWNTSFGTP